jgi:CRISPR system Cascade subunit CasA
MAETSFNLLDDALIRTNRDPLALPDLLAQLCRNEVGSFPALRHHQAPALHAFLVQLAFHAIEIAERGSLPTDAVTWRTMLRGLTEAWPDDTPWCLVAPRDRPAFLQPAVPAAVPDPLNKRVETPDELDVLVTSKNHDLKAARMVLAEPDDWFFALVSVQTQEGQMGRGNYGIARMNGGYGSRPFLGIAPQGGFGARFRRDLEKLRRESDRLWETGSWGTRRELRLLWLEPWDGAAALSPDELHPLFIEICRRIRLDVGRPARLFARLANSQAARVAAKGLKGVTPDPWAPVEIGGNGDKLLSLTAEGFSWRKMHELLLSNSFKLPLLARVDRRDGPELEIVAAGLARGQGKTDGFHDRRVPVPTKARAALQDGTAQLAEMAQQQANDAGRMARSVLRPAILCAFEKGPERVKFDARDAARAAEPFMQLFDAAVDERFFPALWERIGEAPEIASRAWQQLLQRAAENQLAKALAAGPRAEERRFIAAERARGFFYGSLYKNFPALRPGEARQESDNDQ